MDGIICFVFLKIFMDLISLTGCVLRFFFFTVGWLEIFEMHLLWAKYIPLP